MKFYRNFFAALCFGFFFFAMITRSPHGFWGAMICGALSRTAVKKKWPEPPFAEYFKGFSLFGGASVKEEHN